jgi:hypothetical protein
MTYEEDKTRTLGGNVLAAVTFLWQSYNDICCPDEWTPHK